MCDECDDTGEIECPELCAGDCDCPVCDGNGVIPCDCVADENAVDRAARWRRPVAASAL